MLVCMRTGSFLGGETRSFESNTPAYAFPMFSAHAHFFLTYVWVARVYACKRVHTLPAAFFEPNLSLFCGFLRGYNGGKDYGGKD